MIGYIQRKYCKDDISLIENYDKAKADNFKGWDLHHRLELTLDGEFAHTKEELERLDMYYHRPYFELIFLTTSEHMKLHASNRSEEQLLSMSKAQSLHVGELNSFYGKKHTAETKSKISKANTGKVRSLELRKQQSLQRLGIPLSETNRVNKAIAQKEIGIKFRKYQAEGGTMNYNEFRASIRKRKRT